MNEDNKVLLIDKDLSFLSELSNIIKNIGNFKTLIFQNQEDAIKFLQKNKVFAIFSEIFPGIWEIFKSLNLKNVIFITENADNDFATKVINEGALDFILKPITEEQVKILFEKIKLKNKHEAKKSTREIVTNNPKMQLVLKIAENAAKSNATVFIQGESGVGKELLARFIHSKSPRKDNPFIAVNCAALPETLLESELFGHEKGSFTGAIATKPGKFELANKGTILLDEISEMDISLQSKLLRVLQEREIDRIGGRDTIKIDVRVIATTNRNIKEHIKKGKFREDLYYRLNVIPIIIPPLRERKDDIPILAKFFINKHCKLNGFLPKMLTKEAIEKLKNYDWPGNVRELENIIERAITLCPYDTISEDFIIFEDEIEKLFETETFSNKDGVDTKSSELDDNIIKPGLTISEMEKKLILETLRYTNHNRTLAAQLLGISVRTLRNKLNEYRKMGIEI